MPGLWRRKGEIKKIDMQLREQLAEILEGLDFPVDTAHKVAKWNPFDQNAVATWFDPEYMFGWGGGGQI